MEVEQAFVWPLNCPVALLPARFVLLPVPFAWPRFSLEREQNPWTSSREHSDSILGYKNLQNVDEAEILSSSHHEMITAEVQG